MRYGAESNMNFQPHIYKIAKQHSGRAICVINMKRQLKT